MAYVRPIKYRTQACPKCGKRLLKVAEGDIVIASPLLICEDCGCVSYTKLHCEWYNHPQKWMVWGIPLIVAIVSVLLLVLSEFYIPVIFAVSVFWIICIIFTPMDVVRIIKSKKRMRDPEYLELLLKHRVISQEEYEEFMRKANEKRG